MKKFIQLALFSGLVFNLAFADDLLFKLSGGALSENSSGVRKLSSAEMSEVKGGRYLWQGPVYSSGTTYNYVNNYITKPYKNNHNANKYPQTLKQPIYSNHWCLRYGCLKGR